MKNTKKDAKIQLTGTFNDDENEILSDCCAADVYEDHMICSDCNDHCGILDEDFDLDAYCDANPDFNDAMNGDYIGFDSFLENNLIA